MSSTFMRHSQPVEILSQLFQNLYYVSPINFNIPNYLGASQNPTSNTNKRRICNLLREINGNLIGPS